MTHDNDTHTMIKPIHAARLSAQDFAMWGSEHIAYVRPVELRDENGRLTGHMAYGIHAADGNPIGIAETRDLAMATVIREGLEAVSVH